MATTDPEFVAQLQRECDLEFIAYQLAKSEHPGPEWAVVTDPLFKVWQDSQSALFLLGCL